jgi:hypothetical protein
MRLTDTRYDHERLALDVAIRLIQFDARTQTIRACTGLSEDRIRKLYRSYVARDSNASSLKRRRGKAPRELHSVFQNAQIHLQASLLAGTLATVGLLSLNPKRIDATFSSKLCDAFEIYASHLSTEPLSFEHAWFLWRSLQAGFDLQLRACQTCNGATVQDRFSLRARACPWCGTKPPRLSGKPA